MNPALVHRVYEELEREGFLTSEDGSGIFVAEGEKVVRRLLESRFEVVSVLIPEKWLAELQPLLEKRPESVKPHQSSMRMLSMAKADCVARLKTLLPLLASVVGISSGLQEFEVIP